MQAFETIENLFKEHNSIVFLKTTLTFKKFFHIESIAKFQNDENTFLWLKHLLALYNIKIMAVL